MVWGCDHLSGSCLAAGYKRPLTMALHQGGFSTAERSPVPCVRSYPLVPAYAVTGVVLFFGLHTISPLPQHDKCVRVAVCFCCTVPRERSRAKTLQRVFDEAAALVSFGIPYFSASGGGCSDFPPPTPFGSFSSHHVNETLPNGVGGDHSSLSADPYPTEIGHFCQSEKAPVSGSTNFL